MSKKKESVQVGLIPQETIESKIFLIRGKKVILDKDLAEMYGVTTGNLNKAVNRNINRFPEDFMFPLTRKELRDLIFQFGISSWGGTRKLPRAFTEHGVLMLSSVLNSERAAQVNIAIMRAFVKLRELLSTNKELALKLSQLEMKIEKHDEEIQAIFKAIHRLMEPPPEKPKRRIGFITD